METGLAIAIGLIIYVVLTTMDSFFIMDLLAVANDSTHGIFKEQHGMDFKLIPKIRAAVKMPLVQRGTCGISLTDITKLVKAGMTKINFAEGIRMNYIRYFNEFSQTLNHEHHAWRIARAAKDRSRRTSRTSSVRADLRAKPD